MMNKWPRVVRGSFPEFRLLDHICSTGDCMITRVSPPKSEPLKGKSCCSLIDHWRCQCLNIPGTIIICWERVYCNEHCFTLQGQLLFSEALELSLGRCLAGSEQVGEAFPLHFSHITQKTDHLLGLLAQTRKTHSASVHIYLFMFSCILTINSCIYSMLKPTAYEWACFPRRSVI